MDPNDMDDETVGHLRQRLKAMKELVSEEESAKGGKKKRRRGKCIDTIIDGSMMGAVLAVCLAMVLGASFFAYKNLYYAIMRKWYPESYSATYPHGAK